MFKKKQLIVKSELDEIISMTLFEMRQFGVETDEYASATDQLVKLYSLKALEKPERFDRNTLIIAGSNLLGIMLIIGYERTNVVTSKALNLLIRLR